MPDSWLTGQSFHVNPAYPDNYTTAGNKGTLQLGMCGAGGFIVASPV